MTKRNRNILLIAGLVVTVLSVSGECCLQGHRVVLRALPLSTVEARSRMPNRRPGTRMHTTPAASHI